MNKSLNNIIQGSIDETVLRCEKIKEFFDIFDIVSKERPEFLNHTKNIQYVCSYIIASLDYTNLDLKISRTGENEILIYRKDKNGNLYNLIIDEDCDLAFIIIHSKASKSDNRTKFYSEIEIKKIRYIKSNN